MYMSKTRVKSARNWNTRPPTHSCQRFGRKELRRKEIAKTVFRERERERKIASFFVGIIDLRKQKLKAFWASREAAGFSFDPTTSSLSLSLSLSPGFFNFQFTFTCIVYPNDGNFFGFVWRFLWVLVWYMHWIVRSRKWGCDKRGFCCGFD